MWPEHEDPLPWRLKRWLLVERLGWTLDEVENLDSDDYTEGVEVLSALDAARNARSQRGAK